MKLTKLIFISFMFLLLAQPVSAFDTTTKRRPDKTEFVTESHLRLTSPTIQVAEVVTATPPAATHVGFVEYLSQSYSAFIQALRDIFR